MQYSNRAVPQPTASNGYGELPGNGVMQQPMGQPLNGNPMIYGWSDKRSPGTPIETLVQPVTPLGVPLESMAPLENIAIESPVAGGIARGNASRASCALCAKPVATPETSINGVWSSGNFDTSGNYGVNAKYDYAGNFLSGSPGNLTDTRRRMLRMTQAMEQLRVPDCSSAGNASG